MKERSQKVELPADLVNKIDSRLEESEFDTVDDYVSYAMSRIIDLVEEDKKDQMSEDIQSRLQSLGYLDE